MSVSCVLLADSHHGLADGIRSLLGTRFEAVVMVADEVSMVESAARLRPTLAVVDLVLAAGNVAGLMDRLRQSCEDLKVIVLSVHDEPGVAESVLESGADAFVVKNVLGTDLLPAVEAVLRGERFASNRIETHK